jgi:hypothetical protein
MTDVKIRLPCSFQYRPLLPIDNVHVMASRSVMNQAVRRRRDTYAMALAPLLKTEFGIGGP